jgi:hypothetical protein
LLKEERLMIDQPVAQRTCSLGLKVMDDALQRLEGVEKIDFLATHRPFKTTKPVEGLRTQRLGEHHLPAKASGSNLCPSEEFSHGIPPEGASRQRWNLGCIPQLYVQGTPTTGKNDLLWAGSSGVKLLVQYLHRRHGPSSCLNKLGIIEGLLLVD